MTSLTPPPPYGSLLKAPREKRWRRLSPAEKREGRDEAYLAKVRQLPCCICGFTGPVTVHHLKSTGQRGGAMKSPDRFGLPLCQFPHGQDCHGEIEAAGSKNERKWFKDRGIEPLALAAALYAARLSVEGMRRILLAHMMRAEGERG